MDTSLYTARYTAGSRTSIAYDAIKRSLLAGEFALGGRLAEERLARDVGVSRTPVREALSRLHSEGLVDRHIDGGYTPAVPDLREIVELYEVRSGLEHAALHRDIDAVDRDALESLQDDWRQLEGEQPDADPSFVLVDEDFHIRLAGAAGNRSLVEILASVNERIRTVRMHDFLTDGRIEATIEQHLGIVGAVLDGDLDTASTALGAHLVESEDIVQERAAGAIGRMMARRRDER